MLKLDSLALGKKYDRPYLARLWDYDSYNAISRGVFTPRGESVVILFITKEKQESLTQYEDHIDNGVLFWEGERGHGNDERISGGRDRIYVFYRDRHHQDFTFEGRAVLKSYRLYSDRPSKFCFQLVDQIKDDKDIVAEATRGYAPESTERSAIIASRVGQGRFREESLRIWQRCCVSGFTKQCILIASHIKPWRSADNRERLDGYNSLLLAPTYDRLFDKGYIGFDDNGLIMISDKIGRDDIARAGLDENSRLAKTPEPTMEYLRYHRQYVFDLIES
jgi:hypothetical protein